VQQTLQPDDKGGYSLKLAIQFNVVPSWHWSCSESILLTLVSTKLEVLHKICPCPLASRHESIWGVRVLLHALLTAAVSRGEWCDSCLFLLMVGKGIRDINWIWCSMGSTTSVDDMRRRKIFLIQPEIEPRILGHPARNRETLLMSYPGFLMHSWNSPSYTPIFCKSRVSFMALWVIETATGFIYGLESYSYEGKQKTFSCRCVKTKRKPMFPKMNFETAHKVEQQGGLKFTLFHYTSRL
jgi:hypothetical protein